MKKLMLLASVCVAVLVSCKADDSQEKPEEENFKEEWRTTHHFYSEKLYGNAETTESVFVSEADNYRLSFREDGTGVGSGKYPQKDERYDFNFKWKMSDGILSYEQTGEGPGVFHDGGGHWLQYTIGWKVEELTDDKMVLFSELLWLSDFDGGSGRATLRYTFEKVK